MVPDRQSLVVCSRKPQNSQSLSPNREMKSQDGSSNLRPARRQPHRVLERLDASSFTLLRGLRDREDLSDMAPIKKWRYDHLQLGCKKLREEGACQAKGGGTICYRPEYVVL